MEDDFVPKEFEEFLNLFENENPVESLPEPRFWRPWEQQEPEFLDFDGLELDEEDNSQVFNEFSRQVFQQGGNLDSSNQDVIQANLVSSNTRSNPTLNYEVNESLYHIRHFLKSTSTFTQASDALDQLFTQLLRPAIESNATPNDRITVSIHNDQMTKGQLYINKKKSHFKIEDCYSRLLNLAQSNEKILLSGFFRVVIGIARNKRAGGEYGDNSTSVEKWLKDSKSVIPVRVNRTSCGHIAVYIANLLYERSKTKTKANTAEYNSVLNQRRDKHRRLLLEKSKRLAVEAGVNFYEEMEVPTSLEMYASCLNKIIVVFKRDCNQKGYESIHEYSTGSSTDETTERLYIERVVSPEGCHFNAISKPHCYLSKPNKRFSKFCNSCYKPLKQHSQHICATKCKNCLGNNHDMHVKLQIPLLCEDCFNVFTFQECFENHKKKKCKETCQKCKIESFDEKKHTCLTYNCQNCYATYKETPHYCFLRVLDKKKSKREDLQNTIIVAFDIESMFQTSAGEEFHVPNLLISLTCCEKCFNYNNVKNPGKEVKSTCCQVCGEFVHTFKGTRCVSDFYEYIFGPEEKDDQKPPLVDRARKAKAKIRVLAHNFKGYDGRFILREFYKRNHEPNIIISHSKILRLDCTFVHNVSCWFLDSLSFLPTALSKLPKAFGFEDIALKGFFPYLFNTPENLDYVGPLPSLHYYGYDDLPEGKPKSEMKNWWIENQNSFFDLKRELEDYCLNDTKILLYAIQIFRKTFQEICEIDPLSRSFTLPSLAFETFRSKFLEPDQVGVTPLLGYEPMTFNKSPESQVYLDYMQRKIGRDLKREYRLGRFYTDGYDSLDHVVYEYNGCLYHACPKHNPEEVERKFLTQRKLRYYEVLKENFDPLLTVVSIFECEWKEQQKLMSAEDQQYIKEKRKIYHKLKEGFGVNVREAYMGGRTNNRRFYYQCLPGEQICYKDFVSLYPTCMNDGFFPVGHPQVIRDNIDIGNLTTYFGLVSCKVRPPPAMTFPILPLRINKRMVYPLCITCAQDNHQDYCPHSDEERDLSGTWFTPELFCALENGYQVVEVYEIYNWSQYSDSIFKSYIKTFSKLKIEASGFPSNVVTDEEKNDFVTKFEVDTGIQLEKSNIRCDETIRTVSKLMLNSMYGKLAQDQNNPQHELVTTFERFWKLFSDDSLEILNDTNVSEDKVLVSYKNKDLESCKVGNTSLVIAGFVTSYARLRLWHLINKIETRTPGSVLYFDTDSVIYVLKSGQNDIETGSKLGDVTDELGENKCYRAAFLGAKNYMLELTSPDNETSTIIKIKGITLTAPVLTQITADRMIEMGKRFVHDDVEEKEVVPQKRFKSDTNHQLISNLQFEKTHRPHNKKRVVLSTNDTMPFGTKRLIG